MSQSIELTKPQLHKIIKLVYTEAYGRALMNAASVAKGKDVDVGKDFDESIAMDFFEKLPWNDS